MKALVQGHESQERGRGRGRRHRTFTIPIQGGQVVSAGLDGPFAHIKTVGSHVIVEKPAGQLELRVVESAVWVVEADQLCRDVGRERTAPNDGAGSAIATPDRLLLAVQHGVADQTVGCSGMREPNTTGSQARGVVCADHRRRVGRFCRCLWSHRKSSRAAWKPGLSRNREERSLVRRAACRWLNRPREPGRASDMERNSPKSLCHLSRESRRWLGGMELRSSAKRRSLRSGKVMVDDTVSMIQPRTFLQVAHDASPLRNLVTEMGSVRCGGSWSGWRGRRMRSIDSMRRRRTFVRRDSGPWAAAIKSSTKRSTVAKRRR
eukprot:scaffold9232_cov110-Cylindrotheca_fusiformis.AAC.2